MRLFKENVLIIGDIHLPFAHKDYLKHCKDTYKKYKCNRVIFIGDLIDNNFTSFHETAPEAHGAKTELTLAKKELKKWYKAFPKATVTVGNHDRNIKRKAVAGGIAEEWIRDFNEVLEVPGWDFVQSIVLNEVLYVHGEGATNILNAVKENGMSVVAGHTHTKSEAIFSSNGKKIMFGMHTGCGIDDTAYSFEYAKFNVKKSILSCGVVLNDGKQPIVIPMEY